MENFEIVNLHAYYENLKKSDKGKFLNYVSRKFVTSHATLSRKMRGLSDRSFTKLEEEAIVAIIKSGEWK